MSAWNNGYDAGVTRCLLMTTGRHPLLASGPGFSCPVLSFGRYHFSITSVESGESSDPYSGLVGLVRTYSSLLDERASHTAPKSRFLDELEDYMTAEAAE